MYPVEFIYEYEYERQEFTFTVYNSSSGEPIIYDHNNEDVAMYVKISMPLMYKRIVEKLEDEEERAEEQARYEGGCWDEDAWKGYD